MIPKTYLALVADDSEDEQILISRFLRSVPRFKLIGSLHDGAETVSYLRGACGFGDRTKFPYPDLLLLDYQMPGLNGMEVLTLLEFEKTRPRVVLWSNVPELMDEELALRLGADLICRKPSDAFELNAIIDRLEWPAVAPSVPSLSPESSIHEWRA